jgi:hypothetical protein
LLEGDARGSDASTMRFGGRAIQNLLIIHDLMRAAVDFPLNRGERLSLRPGAGYPETG